MAVETVWVVEEKSPGGDCRSSFAGGDGGQDGFGSDGALMAVVLVTGVEALGVCGFYPAESRRPPVVRHSGSEVLSDGLRGKSF